MDKINSFVFSCDININDLAKEINISPGEIVKFLFLQKNKNVNVNQLLNAEIVKEICDYFNIVFQKSDNKNIKNNSENKKKDNVVLKSRPPVVTIMGHVDHGKTTLIDAIRNSNIADKEAGGISQTIGAYQKEYNGKKITFIDTPGHEAFSNMRHNGAQIADIIILVVAADDGVKQQTVEAIKYAKETNATILVAINKIDKNNANIEKTKSELANYNLIPNEYNGDNIFCEISAKKNIGIDNLLDNINLLAELLELKTDINNGSGIVLESKLDKNVGIVTDVLVQNGVLEKDFFIIIDNFICGHVRRMVDDNNKLINKAEASTPVRIIGLKKIVNAGDLFTFFKDKKIAEQNISKDSLTFCKKNVVNRVDSFDKTIDENVCNLNLIIKTSSISLLEVVKNSISKINIEGTRAKIIHSDIGMITDSDIELAFSNKAVIFAFDIRSDGNTKKRIKESKIDVHYHNIIYSLIEDLEKMLKRLLKPKLVEVVTGHLEIRKIFTFEKTNIAGCYAKDGFVKAKSKIRLIRNGKNIYEGVLATLKHKKDDISIVRSGFECGTIIKNFNDIKEQDIIEGYEIKEEINEE